MLQRGGGCYPRAMQTRGLIAAGEQRALDCSTGVDLESALRELDQLVAALLGPGVDEVAYINKHMSSDPFLKQFSILRGPRGRRVRTYSDSQVEDRYDQASISGALRSAS
jgi:hypothetical protein